MSRPGRPGRFIWRVICGQFYVRSAKSAGGIALDVKLTLVVTSAESAEVQMSASADHRDKYWVSQVLFGKRIAIPLQAEILF